MERGVTSGSCGQYDNQWRKWRDFLSSIPEGERPDEYLEEVVSKDDKVVYLAGFVGYLVDTLGMRGAKEVSSVLSGLRFQWTRKGLESQFFMDARLAAAKQGARPSTTEMRAISDRVMETRKLPAFVGMIMHLRQKWYEEATLDSKGLYRMAIYLSAAVSFDMGLRPGNVRRVDGNREDHCMLAGDITFSIASGSGELRVKGGEDLRSYLGVPGLMGVTVNQERLDTVEKMGLKVVTSKTSNRVRAPLVEWEVCRGNGFEESLLVDMCRFMVVSGVKEGDPFCSRWARSRTGTMTRKVVTSHDLSEAVKDAGEAFGIARIHFSSKSLRSGFASHMAACGVSREQYLSRGGWSLKSRVPEKHYIHQTARGSFSTAMDGDGEVTGLGVGKVLSMLPVGQLQVARRAEV